MDVFRSDTIQELAFLNLTYEVDNVRPGKETETLRVLDGVSGQANSREMLALVRVTPIKMRSVRWSSHCGCTVAVRSNG